MAQDATGTPTSLGIPKYNTAADAPSGKGFNAAMDAIDAIIQAQIATAMGQVPAGTVAFTAASAAPTGWLLCDGAAVSRTTYAALFAAIGTQYGVGDGSTTFNVPNMKGRVPVGLDSADSSFDTRGETGGQKTHTLTVNEMPPHNHNPITMGWGPGTSHLGSMATDLLEFGSHVSTSVGGGAAHNNLQPYIVFHGMVKT